MGDRQYAFVAITPDPTAQGQAQRRVTYDIKQGERVYIGRIDITGNDRTIDKVIRRQLLLAEGDPFNATAIHKSEQNLKDLNFFSEAKVTPVDGGTPDRANVKVDLKEKSTGEVAVGAGFSSTDGPLGDFSISEHNFMGQGQDARIGATISGRTRQIDTSFTEPYFMDRDLSAGVDLYHTQTDNQDLSSYDASSTGYNLRMGYPLSQELRQKLNYSFHDDNISNVPSDASLYILEQQGTTTTSSVGQSLVYDTRDSKLDPTLGFITHLDTDIAGAGGSRKWVRVRLGGTQYYPLAEDWIISGTAKWARSAASTVDQDQRALLPRRRYAARLPVCRHRAARRDEPQPGCPRRQPIHARHRGTGDANALAARIRPQGPFLRRWRRAGQIPTKRRSRATPSPKTASLRLSTGVGISWASPFGPVRLDFAEPIIYQTYDKLEHIHSASAPNFRRPIAATV